MDEVVIIRTRDNWSCLAFALDEILYGKPSPETIASLQSLKAEIEIAVGENQAA